MSAFAKCFLYMSCHYHKLKSATRLVLSVQSCFSKHKLIVGRLPATNHLEYHFHVKRRLLGPAFLATEGHSFTSRHLLRTMIFYFKPSFFRASIEVLRYSASPYRHFSKQAGCKRFRICSRLGPCHEP